MSEFANILDELKQSGNYRIIPPEGNPDVVDFSTNDYLGLGCRTELQEQFLDSEHNRRQSLTSSASRLLASKQSAHAALEELLESLYNRKILLFNSGYHANTGIVPAVAAGNSFIIADRLSHASLIDGMVLSRVPFTRFRHNDYEHLERILAESAGKYRRIIIITESVFSMDGDSCDIEKLVELKHRYSQHSEIILYIDEAHAFGISGPKGLGLCMASEKYDDVDIIVGTFGKAAASQGAFVATSEEIRDYLVNRARSFIFSTAVPPLNSAWTHFMIENIITMDSERKHLADLSRILASGINRYSKGVVCDSHIVPFIVGDAREAVRISKVLEGKGYKALAIRTPTVPKGTERLRFSLSAAMSESDVKGMLLQLDNIL